MFLEDTKELMDCTRPHEFHHGPLQKMVPVFFEHMVSLANKVEKAAGTGTVRFASDAHRCCGIVGEIQTASCWELPELIRNTDKSFWLV